MAVEVLPFRAVFHRLQEVAKVKDHPLGRVDGQQPAAFSTAAQTASTGTSRQAQSPTARPRKAPRSQSLWWRGAGRSWWQARQGKPSRRTAVCSGPCTRRAGAVPPQTPTVGPAKEAARWTWRESQSTASRARL